MKWPKYVPFLEARNIRTAFESDAAFRTDLGTWVDRVFGDGAEPVCAALFKGDSDPLPYAGARPPERQGRPDWWTAEHMAERWNAAMKSLGYTEPVRGRWTRRG